MAYSGTDDPLGSTPPVPSLRTSKAPGDQGASLGMPRPSAASLALTGSMGAGSIGMKMMMIERMIADVAKQIPALNNAAMPFISQMRDLGAAAMAGSQAGGIGATNPEAAAPPPPEMGMGGGPGGPGGLVPPPPMAGPNFISQRLGGIGS